MITLRDPLAKSKRVSPITAREENGCYICTSHKPKVDGRYYDIKRDGKNMLLHRYIFETYHGPILEGMIIRHKCDNVLCINPDHLELGTLSDNVQDALERERFSTADKHYLSITGEQITKVNSMLAKGYTQMAIAKELGIAQGTVSHIKSGKHWSVTLV